MTEPFGTKRLGRPSSVKMQIRLESHKVNLPQNYIAKQSESE